MGRQRPCNLPPSLVRAAGVLERRFAISIIYASSDGACRFGEFANAIGSPPPATLSARLGEMVDAGVLERHASGRQVEYRLTERGRRLARVIAALARD